MPVSSEQKTRAHSRVKVKGTSERCNSTLYLYRGQSYPRPRFALSTPPLQGGGPLRPATSSQSVAFVSYPLRRWCARTSTIRRNSNREIHNDQNRSRLSRLLITRRRRSHAGAPWSRTIRSSSSSSRAASVHYTSRRRAIAPVSASAAAPSGG